MTMPATTTPATTSPATTAGEKLPKTVKAGVTSQEILPFTLGNDYYGLDLLTVRAMRAWTEVTPLPTQQPFEIGRASCRERVSEYVWHSGEGVLVIIINK